MKIKITFRNDFRVKVRISGPLNLILVILKQGTNEVLLLFTIIAALVPARKLTILNTFENKILF